MKNTDSYKAQHNIASIGINVFPFSLAADNRNLQQELLSLEEFRQLLTYLGGKNKKKKNIRIYCSMSFC